MTDTDTIVDCIDALDTRPSGLCLRFPDGRAERLAMPSGKATLGAGAGCAVPIRFPGVGPLHCVLFPSGSGWRVRRWASGTLLNGGVFTEAAIEIGDRLQLGPVEIEFVGDERAPEIEPESLLDSAEPLDLIDEEPIPVANSTDDISDYLPVVEESHDARERAAFAQTIAEHADRLEEIARQLADCIADEQTSQREVGELRLQLEDIRHELAHAEQLHVATREAVVELERQLTAQRDAVATVKSPRPKGFGLGRRIWPVGLRRRLALHQLIPIPCAVESLPVAADPVVASDAIEAVDHSACEVNEAPQEVFAVETPQLDWLNQIRDSVTEVSEATNVSEATEVESDAPSEELFSPPVEEKEPFEEPESFLNRFQHLLREDGETSGASSECSIPAQPVSVSIPAAPVALQPQAAGGGDDSIEGYMAGLLQRMRGESKPSSTFTPIITVAAPASTPIESPKEVPASPPVSMVSDLQEIKTAPAPERSHDMAALRNLANHSARHSISVANIRHHREHALTKVVVSVLAIICGLFVMRMSPGYTSPEFIGGLVPMFAGVIWGTRTIVLLLKAIRDGSFLDGEEETPQDTTGVLADEL